MRVQAEAVVGRVKKALALHYLTCGLYSRIRSGGARGMWNSCTSTLHSLCCGQAPAKRSAPHRNFFRPPLFHMPHSILPEAHSVMDLLADICMSAPLFNFRLRVHLFCFPGFWDHYAVGHAE